MGVRSTERGRRTTRIGGPRRSLVTSSATATPISDSLRPDGMSCAYGSMSLLYKRHSGSLIWLAIGLRVSGREL